MRRHICILLWGSSPRMRGTPRYHRCPGIADGIIPAYAGNTIPPVSTPAARRDHPRVCGEHISRNMTSLLTWGSSPRMRGTLKAYNHGNRNPGIIPAYAGNTTLQSRRPDQHGDHPRVCGEHCVGVHFAFEAAGSSPRMRGTRQLRQLGRQRPRIIPAYAGNTMACKPFLRPIRDHPRVCGEHPVTTPDSDTVAGSSPRMRGTRHTCRPTLPRAGIIPAYAGNTPPCSHSHTVTRDHPRVCGEHPFPEYSGLYSTGSSPRMRGTRISAVSAGLKTGIIPAYAGNTAYWAIQMPQFRDHPRVCGEHVHGRCHAVEDQGSSPRMRGTRTGVLGLASRTGIIPAYAGNTSYRC